MNKEIKKQIEDKLHSDKGFISNNNFTLVELSDEVCVMEAVITESSLNPYDIVHGGFIFGLADTCSGTLACTLGSAVVTTNANIMYLHKATGNKLIAKAVFLKKGSKISNVEVEITNDSGTVVAKVELEFFCL